LQAVYLVSAGLLCIVFQLLMLRYSGENGKEANGIELSCKLHQSVFDCFKFPLWCKWNQMMWCF